MRFTIRDLMWLTVVVAVGCGWFLNDRSWRRFHDDRVALDFKKCTMLLEANAEAEKMILYLARKHGETEIYDERVNKKLID